MSFSFASRNYATANFKWQNPAKGPFYGIVVRGKQGSYPTSATDGSAIYTGYGTNTAASGTSYSGYKSVGTGTWYFKAYSYYILDGNKVYDSGKQASATFNCYQCSNCSNCSDCGVDCSYCHNCSGNCHDGCPDAAGGCPYACSECDNWDSWNCGDNSGTCDNCSNYPVACVGNS